MAANRSKIINAGIRLLQDMLNRSLRNARRADGRASGPQQSPRGREQAPQKTSEGYPGDFTGRPTIVYSPVKDGLPDPGEIVWTWVPYEEDHTQGKDRPALIIARDGEWLLALQVTSKDHDRDAAQEAFRGRYWTDIGTGAWDSQGRPSEVRLNRIVRIDPDKVRRIGAILDEDLFHSVSREVLAHF